MTTTAVERGARERTASLLPAKITVLVFWGLAFVGSVIAAWMLSGAGQRLAGHYASSADRAAYQLDRYLAQHPSGPALPPVARLERLRRALDVRGIEVSLDGRARRAGDTAGRAAVSVRAVNLYGADGRRTGRVVRVEVFEPPLDTAVAAQRRDLLMAMGAVLLVFGLGLVWALQRLLTGPFTAMVDVAQAFSGGDTTRRFNDRRADEFGFLATFVNKALDRLLAQQDHLRTALARERESEAALYQEKERAEVTLHSIGDGVISTDVAGNVEYLNPVAERLTGWGLAEARGQPVDGIMPVTAQDGRGAVESPVRRCLREGGVGTATDRMALRRRDHQELAIENSAAPIRDRSGNIIGAVTVFRDVSEARKMAQQLSYQASHDALTGLANRSEFERGLQDALDGARREHRRYALCYLDLDQFKIVNDTCGHVAGDELLRQVAVLLHDRIRGSDVLARLGGDEFGILLKDIDPERAQVVAESLCRAVKEFRFVWDEHRVESAVSIGIAPIREDSQSVSEVLSAADVACYVAKDKGRNQVHQYVPDDNELQQRRGEMQWVARIRWAIDQEHFRLYYQPIVPLQSADGRELHRELLIRLIDESGRIVPPMAFIPAAERYQLMPDIDRWVIRTAFRMLSAQCASDCRWVCTINLSGQSLCDNDFLDFVIRQFETSGVSPRRICFEITETAAVSNLVRASGFIDTLRRLGCYFALDDFGSGLSSFAYLKHLKVDYLKIDGSFVRDMLNNPMDRALVAAINQIGHVVGAQTIAEFVESEETLAALRALGVDYAQGYAIAKPKPFEEVLASGRDRPAQARA